MCSRGTRSAWPPRRSALAVAGLRLSHLYRLVTSGSAGTRPVDAQGKARQGRAGRGPRPAQAAAMEVARPRPRVHVLGLLRADPHDHRGLRSAVQEELRYCGHRPCGLHRLCRRLLRLCGARRPVRVQRHPPPLLPETEGSRLPLLRLTHGRRMDHARDDRPRGLHAPCVPRSSDQHRRLPVWLVGLRLTWSRAGAPAARGAGQPDDRDRLCRPERDRDHVVAGAGRVLQAPSHLHGTVERRLLAPAHPPRRPRQDPGDRLGDDGRGHHLRRRQDPTISHGSSCSTW